MRESAFYGQRLNHMSHKDGRDRPDLEEITSQRHSVGMAISDSHFREKGLTGMVNSRLQSLQSSARKHAMPSPETDLLAAGALGVGSAKPITLASIDGGRTTTDHVIEEVDVQPRHIAEQAQQLGFRTRLAILDSNCRLPELVASNTLGGEQLVDVLDQRFGPLGSTGVGGAETAVEARFHFRQNDLLETVEVGGAHTVAETLRHTFSVKVTKNHTVAHGATGNRADQTSAVGGLDGLVEVRLTPLHGGVAEIGDDQSETERTRLVGSVGHDVEVEGFSMVDGTADDDDIATLHCHAQTFDDAVFVAQRLPTLMVDPILIEQVVLNLVKNAAEAIDNANLPPKRRNIELRVVPRHTPEEGGVIEFTVTDMGPGLKDEVIARMYEAFFSTKTDGLGIGLSLCRSIIESHRGRIKAQNLYNGTQVVGCRFSFTVPVETLHRSDAAAPAAEGETTSPSP